MRNMRNMRNILIKHFWNGQIKEPLLAIVLKELQYIKYTKEEEVNYDQLIWTVCWKKPSWSVLLDVNEWSWL